MRQKRAVGDSLEPGTMVVWVERMTDEARRVGVKGGESLKR